MGSQDWFDAQDFRGDSSVFTGRSCNENLDNEDPDNTVQPDVETAEDVASLSMQPLNPPFEQWHDDAAEGLSCQLGSAGSNMSEENPYSMLNLTPGTRLLAEIIPLQ